MGLVQSQRIIFPLLNLSKYSILKLAFLVCYFSVFNYAEELGWLRVCDSNSAVNQHYEIEANKCPHGSWLSNPISTGCVCLNGLWAIGRSWCDEDYQLFFGKGHCFKLHGEFQKLAFLGDPTSPFATSNFMTKRNGHTFKSFKSEIISPYEFELNFYDENLNKTIIQLNPKESQKFLMQLNPEIVDSNENDLSTPICLQSLTPSPNPSEETTLHVYQVKEAFKSLSIVDDCPTDAEIYDSSHYSKISLTKLELGESLHVKSGKISKASTSCLTSCSSMLFHQMTRIIRHKRGTTRKNTTKNSSVGVSVVNSTSTDSNSKNYMGLTAEENQLLVNEETLRIIKAEVKFLLEKEKPPKLNITNWRILQKAKETLVKVCPKLEAPTFLINAMLRLFRMLYIHTRDFNPYGQFVEENAQNLRIAKVLDSCSNNSSPLVFTYEHAKTNGTCYKKNETIEEADAAGNIVQKEEERTYCPCAEQMEFVNMNYTKNLTYPNENFTLTRPEFTLPLDYSYSLMPVTEKFNGSNRDLPIETAWKIISFAHYYCARYFKDIPADHSAMLVKLESFFNSEIVFRWTHPGLRTNETWQALYSSFQMQRFVESIDACVASAKYVSEYPTWIIRPSLESLQRKKRSLDSEQISNGTTAYCLQEPWDPVNKLGVKVAEECYEWNNL